MRYTVIDLQSEDIMWFGVDKNGYIFKCTSGGVGNVPEFICKSKENNDEICKYFLNDFEPFTKAKMYITGENQLTKESRMLSEKGIFCFDVNFETENYDIVSKPETPLNINQLPNAIKDIMADYTVNINLLESETIIIRHAY